MSRRLVVTLLGLLALGCTQSPPDSGSSREAAVDAPPIEPTPTPPPAPDPWIEPARTHLLVLGHLPEQTKGRVLSISLVEPPISSSSTGPASTRASGPSVGGVHTLAAPPRHYFPGYFACQLTHGGGTRFAAVQGQAERWQLEIRDVDVAVVEPLARIEIGSVLPQASMMVGDRVFLGQDNTVAWIDLAAPAPVLEELHRRPEMVIKAYDLFVRRGSWLIAIDDQRSPTWADGFRLGAGRPERINDFTLPSGFEASYYAGDLVASGPDQGVLYLLMGFGLSESSGHDLTALTIREGELQHSPGAQINRSAGIDPPVVEEEVDRRSGEPRTLVAGTSYSEWTRVVYVPAVAGGQPRLLISAVERGLLELPIEFGPTTKANMIDLGGAVVDVMLIGGRVFGLVNVEQPLARSELVELSLLPSGATVDRRTALPDVYQRFVR